MTEIGSELVPELVVGRKRDGRCIYSAEGKRALVRLSVKRGASVARIAQQHGVNANLLRKWIDAAQGRGPKGRTHAALASTPKLLPVVEISARPGIRESVSATTQLPEPLARGYIELDVRGVTIRLFGEINGDALQTVLGVVAHGS
jgi:transposase-like protein